MKEAGMRIRVEAELREEFVEACKKLHVPAAQVLREYMREFIKKESLSKKLNNKMKSA